MKLSSHLDSLNKGLITTEQHKAQVTEIINTIFDECREDIEKMIQNPSGYLPELIQSISKNPGLLQNTPLMSIPLWAAWYFIAGVEFSLDLNSDFPEYVDCVKNVFSLYSIFQNIYDDIEGETVRDYLEALQELLPLYDGVISTKVSCVEGNMIARQKVEDFIQNLHDWDYFRRFTISFLQEYPELSYNAKIAIRYFKAAIKENQPLFYTGAGIEVADLMNDIAKIFANI